MVGPNPMTCVLMRRERAATQKRRQRRPHEAGGGSRSDTVTSPEGQGSLETPTATKGKEGPSPGAVSARLALPPPPER